MNSICKMILASLVFVAALIGPAAWSFQIIPDREKCRKELVEWGKWSLGLSFEVFIDVSKTREKVSVSKDGRFCEFLGTRPGIKMLLRYGGYSDESKGWCFATDRREPPLDLDGAITGSPHRVTFARPGQSAAGIGESSASLALGFTKKLKFADFFDQSDVKLSTLSEKGRVFVVATCDHPEYHTVIFTFDSDNYHLSFIQEIFVANDKTMGSKYVKDETVLAGEWSRFKMGPFEYGDFEGRRVVKSYAQSMEASGGYKARAKHVLSNFEFLEPDLTEKIRLESFDLQDHQQVTCVGKTDLQFELLNNSIVLVGDGDAIENAKRSRYRNTTAGWISYYSIAGFLMLIVTLVFVWVRNRGE